MVDCRDIPLEATYLKRARQLVKNQRAEWIKEDMIRMKLQYVEENAMAAENTISMDSESTVKESSLEVVGLEKPDDKTILELAKRRLAVKKNLFYQTVDFMLILLCFLSFAVIWDSGTKVLISFFFILFWGGRLLYRIFKFARPSFKDGISNYIKRRNDYKLESEFNRLKKEYLNNQ